MKQIDIILPVYNEAEVIESFNLSLLGVIDKLKSNYHFNVIYVLDKSSDDSLIKLKWICERYPNVSLIHLSKRFGHQMSLVAGMDKCKGDAIIMMDCDLQHPTEVIPELLKKYEEGFDVVHTLRIDSEEITFFKRYSAKLFYWFINLISSVKIVENSADFRLVSKKVINVFQKQIREQNQFLRGLFYWVGFNQTSVSFLSQKRELGKSKYDLMKLIRFAMFGVRSFSKAPLLLATYIGMVISLVSFLYGFYALFAYFSNGSLPRGWTSVAVAISFSLGIQLLFLGIIGSYIATIVDEVKKRPLYIIEEEYGFICDINIEK